MKKTQRKHKRKKRDGFRETTVGNEDVRHIDGQYSISAEIWRWQNKIRLHKINKIKKKYVKWMLCLDRRTLNYILEKDMKNKKKL